MKIVLHALLAAILTLAAMCQQVSAAVINFDFENLTGSENPTANLIIGDFVFSARCHFHVTTQNMGVPSPFGKSLTFDNSGCYGGSEFGYNQNYLGQSDPLPDGVYYPGLMYVARVDGASFSLKSLMFTAGLDGGAYSLSSSKGGTAHADYYSDLYQTLEFHGPLWTNVDWLVFETSGGDDPVGFDNLSVVTRAVPEPGTVSLFGIALIALASRARKARRHRMTALK